MTLATAPLVPGAPGVYEAPPEPLRALTGVRLDVCAFLGVAPRGPARAPVFRAGAAGEPVAVLPGTVPAVPVAVESWDEYRRLFGGFEGPGLLPYAVAAFFEHGGRRAHVVRIVHRYGDARDALGVSRAALAGVATPGGGPVRLRARSEGRWGDGLSARMTFTVRPLAVVPGSLATGEVGLASPRDAPVGTLLRVGLGAGRHALAVVSALRREWDAATGAVTWRALLDPPLPAAPPHAPVEVVEGALELDDGAGRRERFDRAGLAAAHPRWLARLLVEGSVLAWPDDDPATTWVGAAVLPSPALDPTPVAHFGGGLDRWADLVPEDFLDPAAVSPADETPRAGVAALAQVDEVALVCAPDLYHPVPLPPAGTAADPASLAGAAFERCVPLAAPASPAPPPDELTGLQLDPALPADLARVTAVQRELLAFVAALRGPVLLLDVPPRLTRDRLLAWRAQFDSAFAAAYHPWLRVARPDDARDALVRLPPSAAAAGLIARRELADGIPFGPANLLTVGVVGAEAAVTDAEHDELHPLGVNVFRPDRDGLRLMGARTLSRDPQWRQLSVRRLVTMLCRTVDRELQWLVFEPNGPALRAELVRVLTALLRRLFRAGAFRGATEAEAFFVRCDASNNPDRLADLGQLVAEIGVAPAEPLEFIVLRVVREGDGRLLVEG